MLRVALFPADETGCGMFRMRWPAAAVAAAAGDVEVHFSQLRREGMQVVGMPAGADVAVFQRPLHALVPALIPKLRTRGVAVVVELDDDFGALHPQCRTFRDFHPAVNPVRNWHHLKQACKLADLVTVTTPALAARYGGSKARVLPNCVPASMLTVRADRDGRTVGWGGATQTHIGDLTVTNGGVAQAIADTGARFLSVGPSDGVQRDLSLLAAPDSTDGLEFDEYHQALAQLDVGIAPLADTAFNAAKSGLKVLEYAALGIASVASPRPDYQRLHDDGIGLIATDRSRAWRRQVRQLLTDVTFRDETVAQARQVVSDRHTYETNGWRWAECWQEALHNRRLTGKVLAA